MPSPHPRQPLRAVNGSTPTSTAGSGCPTASSTSTPRLTRGRTPIHTSTTRRRAGFGSTPHGFGAGVSRHTTVITAPLTMFGTARPSTLAGVGEEAGALTTTATATAPATAAAAFTTAPAPPAGTMWQAAAGTVRLVVGTMQPAARTVRLAAGTR